MSRGGIGGAHAQGSSPGNNGPFPQVALVPLDGGASRLLAAGVGLGLKKLRHRRPAR